MQTLKRSVILQSFVFLFFLTFGIITILSELIEVNNINYYLSIAYPVIIIIGVIVFFKTPKETVIVVDNIVSHRIKISLYGLALGLLIGFLKAFEYYQVYFTIASGIIVLLAGLYGFYHTIKTLKD